jgi:hypothetical protein
MSSNLPTLTADVLAAMPSLRPGTNCEVTSPRMNRYNCVAWAANVTTQWWWPIGPYYWPPTVARELKMKAFVRAYKTLGYISKGSARKVSLYLQGPRQ